MTQANVKDFESGFPKMDAALKNIETLKQLNLKSISMEKLDTMINHMFPMIPIGRSFIPKDTLIFRARVNPKDEEFNHIKQISIRDAQDINSFGRANQHKEAIFYGASNLKMACCEVLQDLKYSFNLKREIGLTTVGVWRVLKDLQVAPIYYSEAVCKVREDIAEYKTGNKEFMRKKNLISPSTIDVSDLIMEFFCEEFSKNPVDFPEQYKFSASYSRRIKQANSFLAKEHLDKSFHGLVYPSVAMKFKGDNIALFAENLYSKIKLETAYQVICTNLDFENGDLKSYFLHELDSIDVNGSIIWKKNLYGYKD